MKAFVCSLFFVFVAGSSQAICERFGYGALWSYELYGESDDISRFLPVVPEGVTLMTEAELGDYYGKVGDVLRVLKKGGRGATLERPNIHYSQIAPNGALALEVSYGRTILWTPLGRIEVRNTVSFRRMEEELGLVLIMPKRDVGGLFGGEFGPVYAITQGPEGVTFPENVFRLPGLIGWETGHAIWERIRPASP